jgi:hypothetical protein
METRKLIAYSLILLMAAAFFVFERLRRARKRQRDKSRWK